MPYGDRIALILGRDDDSRSVLLLASAAAGTFRAQPSEGSPLFAPSGGYYENAYAAWRDTATGYAIEARLPLRIVDGAIGVGIIDSYDDGQSARQAAATWGGDEMPNLLVRESPVLNGILEPYAGGNERIRILDPNGWVLADSGPLGEAAVVTGEVGTASIVERVFRYLLRRDDPAARIGRDLDHRDNQGHGRSPYQSGHCGRGYRLPFLASRP